MLLPIADQNWRMSAPRATMAIIAINVLVFVATGLWMPELDYFEFCRVWGFIPAKPGVLTVVTSMFLHADVWHLAGNMWVLWIFGRTVEDELGPKKFLIVYGATGLVAKLAHSLLTAHPEAFLYGASGAVSGVIGAYAMLVPQGRIRFFWCILFSFGVITLPAWSAIIYYFVMDAIGLLLGGGNVAHWSHLGGLASGLLGVRALRGWLQQEDDESRKHYQAVAARAQPSRVPTLSGRSSLLGGSESKATPAHDDPFEQWRADRQRVRPL